MTIDTKLGLHNTTSKASLCYGSKNCNLNKRDTQTQEAAQMRFLRPLLGHKDWTTRETLTSVTD
jgi:hypothetical protein